MPDSRNSLTYYISPSVLSDVIAYCLSLCEIIKLNDHARNESAGKARKKICNNYSGTRIGIDDETIDDIRDVKEKLFKRDGFDSSGKISTLSVTTSSFVPEDILKCERKDIGDIKFVMKLVCDLVCKAKIVEIDCTKGWNYLGCPRCHKKVQEFSLSKIKVEDETNDFKTDENNARSVYYRCVDVCGKIVPNVTPRYKVFVLKDQTNKHPFVLFDRDVENIVKISCRDLMETMSEDDDYKIDSNDEGVLGSQSIESNMLKLLDTGLAKQLEKKHLNKQLIVKSSDDKSHFIDMYINDGDRTHLYGPTLNNFIEVSGICLHHTLLLVYHPDGYLKIFRFGLSGIEGGRSKSKSLMGGPFLLKMNQENLNFGHIRKHYLDRCHRPKNEEVAIVCDDKDQVHFLEIVRIKGKAVGLSEKSWKNFTNATIMSMVASFWYLIIDSVLNSL
ncbi:OLC1v1016322C1 [Oldenlandia corymbosa var. corymbosa]|uniref:OLC1v1016322C1 n=1 Tax=Oldenlandia corymbosa var. corymbosa TaxID=529605 RepID=A0AAV1E5P8_OLDCO|nr:OLC1v1016322C1 [Oldenlandia corymbosa var. corymbosa]